MQQANVLPDVDKSDNKFDLSTLDTTLPQRISQTSPLLNLPTELRLQIYSLALAHPIAPHQKLSHSGGRTRIRITWPSAPYHLLKDRTPIFTLNSLLSLSSQTRADLLPSFLRTTILKFPAWNPDFKLQCLYWLEGVSETFVRGVSWVWFEGVYWRFSIRLGTDGEGGEDEKATREDCHQYEESEWFAKEERKFVVRLDFVKQMRRQARDAVSEIVDLLEELVDEDGRLGRKEMRRVLNQSRLTVEEQLRGMSHRNYGIRTVYPPR